MSGQAQRMPQEREDTAIQSLLRDLHSRDGMVRQSARRTLVSMGRPAVPIFIRALDSDNRNVRWEAAKALEEIGDPSAAEALVAKLDHDHFGIRWLVAEGLISFGRQGLEPLLLALLNDPDAAFLREGAHHVLHALCDADPSLQDILSPLAEALGAFAETGEIIPRVQAVLKAIRDKCDTHRTEISEQTREQ